MHNGINLCRDFPPEEQIAALRHFLMAGDLVESFDDITADEDEADLSFIQVRVILIHTF